MELNKSHIKRLLDLYEEGETTLDQEQELNRYFSSGNYDSEFEAYAILFQYFGKASKTKAVSKFKPLKKNDSKFWLNIAASICIVAGGIWYYQYHNQQEQELEKARMAFEKTQNALNLLSMNMNEGLEKLEYVEVFSTQKNKILK